MSDENILGALREVQARIAKAEEDIANLQAAVAAAKEEEKLLLRILDLRRLNSGEAVATQLKEPVRGLGGISGESRVETGPKHASVQAVVKLLAESGRPLHISELMRLLHDAGVEIPGQGIQANLIAHLRRDPRIVRPSRGMYALAAWGLENMPVAANKQRRKRRTSQSESAERSDT